jgi:hypothetical protein
MRNGERWRFWQHQGPDGASYDSFYASFYEHDENGRASRHRRRRSAGVGASARAIVAGFVPGRRTVLLSTVGVVVVGALLTAAVTVMASGTGSDRPSLPGLGDISVAPAGVNGIAGGALPTPSGASSRAGAPATAGPGDAGGASGVPGAGSVTGAGGVTGAGLAPSSGSRPGGVPAPESLPAPGPATSTPTSTPTPTPIPPAPTTIPPTPTSTPPATPPPPAPSATCLVPNPLQPGGCLVPGHL